MTEAVIVAGARSPIGRAYKGSLAQERPEDLTVAMVRAALAQVPELDPATLDDLILGCGLPGGIHGNNLARVVAVMLGYDALPGTTVTRYCASSAQSLRMAFHAIKAGEGDAFLAAGVESVSNERAASSDAIPGMDLHHPDFAAALARTRTRAEGGAASWTDPRAQNLLPDVYMPMGQTAEIVAQVYGITRAEQDAFALRSQLRARDTVVSGHWAREITPYRTGDGILISADDSPRPGTTAEGLADLSPVFRPDGTVTAGNACPLNDGAAALVVMSDARAKELGLRPLARVVATGVSGVSPEIMGVGPVESSRAALRRAGMSVDDVDLWEINEAFAVQVLACVGDLGLDLDAVNVSGGAIAVGHPFGMTGARMVMSLLNNLQAHEKSVGVVTMCTAGGQGTALVLERMS